MDNTNVYSRRLQTWEQEFESDTTRPNWEYRLIVKYECLSAELLPKMWSQSFLLLVYKIIYMFLYIIFYVNGSIIFRVNINLIYNY